MRRTVPKNAPNDLREANTSSESDDSEDDDSDDTLSSE